MTDQQRLAAAFEAAKKQNLIIIAAYDMPKGMVTIGDTDHAAHIASLIRDAASGILFYTIPAGDATLPPARPALSSWQMILGAVDEKAGLETIKAVLARQAYVKDTKGIKPLVVA
jgi:hypothetical protein